MGTRPKVEDLRRALYRPGADGDALRRYEAVAGSPRGRRNRRVVAGVLIGAAAVAGATIVLERLPPPLDPGAALAPEVRGAITDSAGFADEPAAIAGLPRARASVRGAGEGGVHLVLDRFGEVVGRDSRITVTVTCRSGPFTVRLSSVTQGRSQILLSELASTTGECGGVQRVRYRPLLGLLPTALEVAARGAVRVEATID